MSFDYETANRIPALNRPLHNLLLSLFFSFSTFFRDLIVRPTQEHRIALLFTIFEILNKIKFI